MTKKCQYCSTRFNWEVAMPLKQIPTNIVEKCGFRFPDMVHVRRWFISVKDEHNLVKNYQRCKVQKDIKL